MGSPSGRSGGSSDQFSVSPSVLQSASPKYANAAQDLATLQQTLVSAVQLASDDLFVLLEFAQLASKLVQLQARIDVAMECAIIGLNRVSTALEMASEESTETDQQVSNTFTRLENDPNPWNTPTIPNILPPLYPGFEPPIYPQPGVQPPVKPGEPPIIPIIPIEPII